MSEVKLQLKLNLPYFYGTETESFLFYKLPKILFTDDRFKDLSSDSKLLYSFMLDRVALSISSNWTDKQGRVYIIYTNEEACSYLGKSKKTVSKFMSELDKETGMGLIERKKRGLGKPDLIYVKNLTSLINEGKETGTAHCENQGENQKIPQNSTADLHTFQGDLPVVALKPNVDNLFSEQNLHLQSGNDYTYRGVKSTPLEGENLPTIKTDLTNTEFTNTDLLKPTFPPNPTPTYPQSHPHYSEEFMERWEKGWEDMDKEEKVYVIEEELGKANVNGQEELSYLMYNYRTEPATLEMVLDVLLDMDTLNYQDKSCDEYSTEKFRVKSTKLYKQALLQMLTDKSTKTKHGILNYGNVIDKILPHIVGNGYYNVKLDSIVDCTVASYLEASKETEIKCKLPYMKSCIWTTLLEGNIHEEAMFYRHFG